MHLFYGILYWHISSPLSSPMPRFFCKRALYVAISLILFKAHFSANIFVHKTSEEQQWPFTTDGEVSNAAKSSTTIAICSRTQPTPRSCKQNPGCNPVESVWKFRVYFLIGLFFSSRTIRHVEWHELHPYIFYLKI